MACNPFRVSAPGTFCDLCLLTLCSDAFLTVDDIRALQDMKNQVLMVFRAPPGTKLDLSEVDDPEKRYRIEMQSPGGPIGVWVINEPQEPENPPPPVVAQPPELLPTDYLETTSMFLNDDFGISDYYTNDDIFSTGL